MRMVFTHHVADDTGAFLETAVRIETQLPHRMKQAPVHRFQTIAHIRQGARRDGRHGVGHIALGQGVRERDGADIAPFLRV